MTLLGRTRTFPGELPIPSQAGVGLRAPHFSQVAREKPLVPWFELDCDRLLCEGSTHPELLEIAKSYPLSLHAIGLSLGARTPPTHLQLRNLADLVSVLEPGLVSDHLSWGEAEGVQFSDLSSEPYSWEALRSVARNVQIVQEALKRRLIIESPALCSDSPRAAFSECGFMAEVVLRTGCGVLLNINNVYVNACNNGSSPMRTLYDFLEAIDPADIEEIHLAGHTINPNGTLLVDSRYARVPPSVWELFERAVEHLGPCPTLIEWDTCIPSFEVLLEESASAERILAGRGVRRNVV
jgi:uncharacterized protein (UPF0276 family)